jgi:hypothetical protein
MQQKRTTASTPSLTSLAAALLQIASMDELPCVPLRPRTDVTTRALNYDFRALCRRYRDGDDVTRTDREQILHLIAGQLHDMGFEDLRADDLEDEHVERLVERWIGEGLSCGTIKNRMITLRWLARRIGNPSIVEPTNAAYGIRTLRGPRCVILTTA